MAMFVEDLGRPGLSGLWAEVGRVGAEADAAAVAGAASDTGAARATAAFAATGRGRDRADAAAGRHLRLLPPLSPSLADAGAPEAEAPGTWAPTVVSMGPRSDTVRASVAGFHAFMRQSACYDEQPSATARRS